MLAEITTVCFQGICAIPITVQVHIAAGGLPTFSIVGLADKAVNESRDRIRAALHTLGLGLPPKRITMNLSPANIQKEGSHYDLPLALGLLAALDIIPLEQMGQFIALGELGLDGTIKAVRGVLSSALLASAENKTLICPAACGGEAVWGGDLEVLAPGHLNELMNHFKRTVMLPIPHGRMEDPPQTYLDLSDIHGQDSAKRVLMIAAAGRHNVLMSGPPGAGKSMLASRIMTLLPPLSAPEALEVTMIHSLSGLLKEGCLLRSRPFRNPHHSVSMPALVGGGLRGAPGEISLAHRGVLFLDELGEFARPTLESLRQSMETRQAVVSRANHRAIYPADFQLIAAMNPCRCGYLGDPQKQCTKAPLCGRLYQDNLSGPLLDRIDMVIEVPRVPMMQLAHGDPHPPQSQQLREKVDHLWKFQMENGLSAAPHPPELDGDLAKSPEAKKLLLRAAEKFGFSARSYYRQIHVARTIALWDGSESITAHAMAEALSYRVPDGGICSGAALPSRPAAATPVITTPSFSKRSQPQEQHDLSTTPLTRPDCTRAVDRLQTWDASHPTPARPHLPQGTLT